MSQKFPVMYDHDHLKNQVILGPCPGCEAWTLQYDRLAIVHIFDSNEEFHEYVEGLLREHLRACAGLQEIVGPDTP